MAIVGREKDKERGPDGICPDDLPISTHERVLGADIRIHAQWIYREMHGLKNPSGFSEGVEIEAVGTRTYLDGRNRRYIAAWARRNLFGGAKPDV